MCIRDSTRSVNLSLGPRIRSAVGSNVNGGITLYGISLYPDPTSVVIKPDVVGDVYPLPSGSNGMTPEPPAGRTIKPGVWAWTFEKVRKRSTHTAKAAVS